ncbi:DUF1931 domain-containing protein [Candidatus Woesearchaeota archaeon]|nr:DUF1931 domain-containing protein [Candidatus Woesearchaeota archaeon]
MADLLVVKSKIKDFVQGLNVAGDFAEALDEEVKAMVKKAVERAKANNRKTLMAKDL